MIKIPTDNAGSRGFAVGTNMYAKEVGVYKNMIPVSLGNLFAGAVCVAASYSYAFGKLGQTNCGIKDGCSCFSEGCMCLGDSSDKTKEAKAASDCWQERPHGCWQERPHRRGSRRPRCSRISSNQPPPPPPPRSPPPPPPHAASPAASPALSAAWGWEEVVEG